MTVLRPVRYRCILKARLEVSGGAPAEVRLLDLSEAGAFVEESRHLPDLEVGDRGTLTLTLPSNEALPLPVVVTRFGTSRREVKHPRVEQATVLAHGYGVEFDGVGEETEDALRDYLELLDLR